MPHNVRYAFGVYVPFASAHSSLCQLSERKNSINKLFSEKLKKKNSKFGKYSRSRNEIRMTK